MAEKLLINPFGDVYCCSECKKPLDAKDYHYSVEVQCRLGWGHQFVFGRKTFCPTCAQKKGLITEYKEQETLFVPRESIHP